MFWNKDKKAKELVNKIKQIDIESYQTFELYSENAQEFSIRQLKFLNPMREDSECVVGILISRKTGIPSVFYKEENSLFVEKAESIRTQDCFMSFCEVFNSKLRAIKGRAQSHQKARKESFFSNQVDIPQKDVQAYADSNEQSWFNAELNLLKDRDRLLKEGRFSENRTFFLSLDVRTDLFTHMLIIFKLTTDSGRVLDLAFEGQFYLDVSLLIRTLNGQTGDNRPYMNHKEEVFSLMNDFSDLFCL